MKRPAPVSWQSAAAAVARAIPKDRLEPSVLTWTEHEKRSRSNWGVALSGGADSVALLLLVWAHWPKMRTRLRVLHFNHRLRADSRADVVFCRRLCRGLGVQFRSADWKRPASAARPSEAEARDARMAFLSRARVVWLAHHQDDIAETLLMRIARGSGTSGLSAPRPIQLMPGGRVHLRPLLTLRKQELLSALLEAGVPWREDSTNSTGDYFRNRVRMDVIPAWEAAAMRNAVAGAARSRELLAEDDAALDAWVDALAPFDASGDLLLNKIEGKPRAVVRRSLHRWLRKNDPVADISRQAFDALLSAVQRGRATRQSLGRNVFAVIRQNRLYRQVGSQRGNLRRRVN